VVGWRAPAPEARGLPGAPLGFDRASPRRYGLRGSLRAAPTASNAGTSRTSFSAVRGRSPPARARRVAKESLLTAEGGEGWARRGTGWGRGKYIKVERPVSNERSQRVLRYVGWFL